MCNREDLGQNKSDGEFTYPEHWQLTSQCLLLSPHILAQFYTTVSQKVHNLISLVKVFITGFFGSTPMSTRERCPTTTDVERLGEFPRARETTVCDTTLYV